MPYGKISEIRTGVTFFHCAVVHCLRVFENRRVACARHPATGHFASSKTILRQSCAGMKPITMHFGLFLPLFKAPCGFESAK